MFPEFFTVLVFFEFTALYGVPKIAFVLFPFSCGVSEANKSVKYTVHGYESFHFFFVAM